MRHSQRYPPDVTGKVKRGQHRSIERSRSTGVDCRLTERVDAQMSASVILLSALVVLGHETDRKAALFHACVRHESHPKIVAGRVQFHRQFGTAELAEQRSVFDRSVAHFHVIVGAIFVCFQFKRVKTYGNLIIGSCLNGPNALLVRRVLVRIVGRLDQALFTAQSSPAKCFRSKGQSSPKISAFSHLT
jgi:hypothetical protein